MYVGAHHCPSELAALTGVPGWTCPEWERAVPVPYVSSAAASTLQAWSCVAETDPAAHGARSTHCLRVDQGGLPSPGLEDAKPLVLLRTPRHLSGTPHCRNLFIFQKRRVVLLLTE